ncbi:MAG: PIN domain-containing protein [Victivallales bacterium]|nr:PIN domain-containing protein [Victivallales bacterium]MCF7888816.1 PIN domain-containing protein [Victivallales bacterium]
MKVLVDTCIWSKALRRKNSDNKVSQKLSDLIFDGRVVIIGPIRQEILSGITHKEQFEKIKNHLSAFEDIPLQTKHFVKAAEFNNLCRSNGIQGSAIDYLICSIAFTNNFYIYTDDKDFTFYRKYLPIKLINS